MKPWYEIKAAADPNAVEVYIMGEIGWEVTAAQFISAVQALKPQALTVRINSLGGSVFEGLAIYAFLKRQPNVVTCVEGVAASMASVIAMAGKEIRMASNSFLMLHNPLGGAYGNADDLRDYAELLEKVGGQLAATYATRSGKPVEEIQKLMDAETWMTAADAKAAGLADTITDEIAFAADASKVSAFRNAPTALTQPRSNPKPKTAATMKNLLEALHKAGLISAVDLSDEAATAEFVANLENVMKPGTDALAKLSAYSKRDIVAKVDAAITAGRIKAAAKDEWVDRITKDASAETLLASLAPSAPGSEPLKPNSPKAEGKTKAELRAEFDKIVDPKARTLFWNAHKAELLKP